MLALTDTHRKGDAVFPSELADKVGCNERIVRDVLNIMEDHGFLSRSQPAQEEVRFHPSENF